MHQIIQFHSVQLPPKDEAVLSKGNPCFVSVVHTNLQSEILLLISPLPFILKYLATNKKTSKLVPPFSTYTTPFCVLRNLGIRGLTKAPTFPSIKHNFLPQDICIFDSAAIIPCCCLVCFTFLLIAFICNV